MSQPISPFPPYDDDPNVPDTFVDGTLGINFVNGNMHITFFTMRMDHRRPVQQAPPIRRVTLRLVIPIAGAVDLQKTIDNMMQVLREQKMVQTMAIVQGPQTRQ